MIVYTLKDDEIGVIDIEKSKFPQLRNKLLNDGYSISTTPIPEKTKKTYKKDEPAPTHIKKFKGNKHLMLTIMAHRKHVRWYRDGDNKVVLLTWS